MVRRLHDEETMRSRDSIMREYIEKGLSLQYTTFRWRMYLSLIKGFYVWVHHHYFLRGHILSYKFSSMMIYLGMPRILNLLIKSLSKQRFFLV